MKFLYTLLVVLALLPLASALSQTNYTTSATYTVPAGTSYVLVQMWGNGGGGGGGACGGGCAGSGGGSGAFSSDFVHVTPGATYTVAAGSVGASSAVNTAGGDATTFSFYNSTLNITAAGGTGGQAGAGGGGSGAGASSFSIAYSGASGAASVGCGAGAGGVAALSTLVSSNGNGANGGACGGGGGAGNVGKIIITEFNTSDNFGFVSFNSYDANSVTLIPLFTNVTLTSFTGNAFFNFSFNQTYPLGNRTLFPTLYASNTFALSSSIPGYSQNKLVVTTSPGTFQNINLFSDNTPYYTNFQIKNGLNANLENITVTFARYINNTVTTFSQVRTDSTGFFSVYLNPSITYFVTFSDSTGVYQTKTGYFTPSFTNDLTFTYVMTSSSGAITPPVTELTNTYYVYTGTFYNSTSKINLTFEVTNSAGGLSYFFFNTSYGGLSKINNFSTAPGGGIINITIENVNLTVQDTLNITYTIKNSNFSQYQFSTVMFFGSAQGTNSSITGGLFRNDLMPTSGIGRGIFGMIILILAIAAIMTLTGSPEAGIFTGFVITGFLAFVGLFPVLVTIIVLMVGALIFFGDGMVNR